MAITDNKKKKVKKIIWGIFGLGFLSLLLIFTLISIGWIGYLPKLEELQNPIDKSATEIYSADMQLLGRYYRGNDNRVPINYMDIDKTVVNALIATEDVRFYRHSGIDFKALMRVVYGIMTGSTNLGGGSTITQQLAKQLYSPKASNIFTRALQKPIEWVIAVKLERLYSKEEIIAMYLNQFDFLYNAVGIKSAAQVYFNTSADKLNVEQAAMLIGMCKNPSYFNPVRYAERSVDRRNMVIEQMRKAKYISQAEADSIKQIPLELDFKRVDHKDGLAPYYREHLRKILTAKKPSKSDYASWQTQLYEDNLWSWENDPLYGFFEKNRKSDGSKYDLYQDGLKIYTTIDSRMQTYAEAAVREHMKSLQKEFFREKKGRSYAPFARSLSQKEVDDIFERSKSQTERYRKMKNAGATKEQIDESFSTRTEMSIFSYDGWIDTVMTPLDSIRYHKHFLRCGVMSMDPTNGHVKAYVGGPDYTAFQYDMVTLGRRQVGSTIKPFLYTLAMEEGLSPCDSILNDEITIMTSSGPWTPRNASSARKGEMVSLRWGLMMSSNWVSARLMSMFTPDALASLIHSFGVRGKIDPVVSLALGPAEISVAEMVSAYTAFPQKGIRVEPLYVSHIEDSNGNIVGNFVPKMHEIFSANTAYKMVYLMRSVVDEGTGNRIRRVYGLNMPMGGKTGTTNNNSDGWFMGYTPKLVTGVWVGGEERSIRFDTMTHGQGAAMALPIWGIYMKKVLDDKDLPYSVNDQFSTPPNWTESMICN